MPAAGYTAHLYGSGREPGSGAGSCYPGGSRFQSFGTWVGPGRKVLPPGWVRVSKFCYSGGSSSQRNGAANCQIPPGYPGYPGTRVWALTHTFRYWKYTSRSRVNNQWEFLASKAAALDFANVYFTCEQLDVTKLGAHIDEARDMD